MWTPSSKVESIDYVNIFLSLSPSLRVLCGARAESCLIIEFINIRAKVRLTVPPRNLPLKAEWQISLCWTSSSRQPALRSLHFFANSPENKYFRALCALCLFDNRMTLFGKLESRQLNLRERVGFWVNSREKKTTSLCGNNGHFAFPNKLTISHIQHVPILECVKNHRALPRREPQKLMLHNSRRSQLNGAER
jgi:hypothetical protein